MNNVKLEALNSENWYECCKLEVAEEQKHFIESNAISITQSMFEPTLMPYVIYYEEKVVGFLMFNSVKEELGGYWVYRIMVAQSYQGKGIGRAATKLMLLEMEKLPDAQRIIVGYHRENKSAHHLYSSLGFIDYGNRFGKEMAVIKTLD